MSHRQIRRLQELISRHSEIDTLESDEEEDDSLRSSQFIVPNRPNNQNKQKHRRRKLNVHVDPQPIVVSNHEADEDKGSCMKHSSLVSSSSDESGSLAEKEIVFEEPQVAIVEKRKGEKKQKQSFSGLPKSNAGNSGKKQDLAGSARKSKCAEKKHCEITNSEMVELEKCFGERGEKQLPNLFLPEKLMCCDVDKLNPRLEKIRMVGVHVLEDLGDDRSKILRKKGKGAGTTNTGKNSMFPEHRHIPFPKNPLATPNCYRWPPMCLTTKLNLVVSKVGKLYGVEQKLYNLELDPSFNTIEEDWKWRVIGSHDLLGVAASYPFHIPMLTNLARIFAMEDNEYRGHEAADMLMYRLGTVFQSANFNLSGTWRERELRCNPSTKQIFDGLRVGFHHATQRGCNRASFEIARLLLSLDHQDPAGALLLIDYAALRSRQWLWLLEVVQESYALMKVGEKRNDRRNQNGGGANAGSSGFHDRWSKSVARRCTCLPGFAFSGALACFLLEREVSQGSTPDSVLNKRDRGNREIVEQFQRSKEAHAFMREPPLNTEELLREAFLRFPITGMALVNALGGFTTLMTECKEENEAWEADIDSEASFGAYVEYLAGTIRFNSRLETEYEKGLQLMHHLTDAFVKQQAEFWKASGFHRVLAKTVFSYFERPKDPLGGENAPLCPSVMFAYLRESVKYYMESIEETLGVVPFVPREADWESETPTTDSDFSLVTGPIHMFSRSSDEWSEIS